MKDVGTGNGIDEMSEQTSSVGITAMGGKVWVAPKPVDRNPVEDRFMRIADSFLGALQWVLFAMMVLLFVTALVSLFMPSDAETAQPIVNAVQQEYGYQEVSFNVDEAEAEVTASDNEVRTLDMLTYKGATILYEDQDQLNEKIAKVKSGTYPEELYLDR